MSGRFAFFVLVFAVLASGVSLVTSGGFSTLSGLKRTLAMEEQSNQRRVNQVIELRSEIDGVMNDKRALEKAARNQLGLARPNELIFFFDDQSSSTLR